MYFLVNASPPKRFDVATSNFADALVNSKAGFAMVYHRLLSLLALVSRYFSCGAFKFVSLKSHFIHESYVLGAWYPLETLPLA